MWARNVFVFLKEFAVTNVEVQRCQNSTFQQPDILSFKIGDELKLAFSLPPFCPFPQKTIFVRFYFQQNKGESKMSGALYAAFLLPHSSSSGLSTLQLS